LTAETAKAVTVFSPDDIVLLPLYPQYSTTTTGSSLAKWQAVYKGAGRTHVVCCYPDQQGLIEAHAQRVLGVLNDPSELTGLRLIFSAHGLPEKVIAEGDPYQHQVERSAEALAARLGVSDWRISYQSRVGPMRWIGPSTIEVIQQAGQDGVGVLVVPIAFVSEHSETLVELDIEYRHLAEAAGVPSYLRAPAVGIEPHFIEGMANMVLNALSMDSVTAGSSPCGKPFGKCPKQRQTRP
jgi:ferrochelatase